MGEAAGGLGAGRIWWGSALRYPFDRLDRTYHEGPRYRSAQQHTRGHCERPEEVPCAPDDKSGQRRRNNSSKIAHKILKTGPFTRRERPCQRLRDGPKIRGAQSRPSASQKEKKRGEPGIKCENRHRKTENGGQRQAERSEGLAHASGSAPVSNPKIRDPTGDQCGKRKDEICRAANSAHFLHGKISLTNEIAGQPGEQEIGEVVVGKQSGKRAPRRAMLENLSDAGSAGGGWNCQAGTPGHPFHPWQ